MPLPGVLAKLQLKSQSDIVVLGAPASFEPILNQPGDVDDDWSAFRVRRREFIPSR